jgi:leucyl aminopeptidase
MRLPRLHLRDAGRASAVHAHTLVLLPFVTGGPAPAIHQEDRLRAALDRRREPLESLLRNPVATESAAGRLIAYGMVDRGAGIFDQQSAVRRAMQLVLQERPGELAVIVSGDAAARRGLARLAVYDAWLNGVPLETRKKEAARRALTDVFLYGSGFGGQAAFSDLHAIAEGSTLARGLTVLPPNELTPRIYRDRLRAIARERGWKFDEWGVDRLRRMGAGAFVAVAQGSADDDAAIVRLSHRPRGARATVALVGKGICFDTGGHNLKSAKHMYGMHEDMNGSAVALGLLHAIAASRLPLAVDAWLAIAQNHIGPRAYKQNDVITALDGTTIEIVHTDAEGRMVLADALTLAARGQPDLVVDFATLTGSMITAVGHRYSGVFCSDDRLAALAVAAGRATGERVVCFPGDSDYDVALDSRVADVKQCTPDGEADHILATRFLSRFVGRRPWIHVDLAASNHQGGLGACASDATGFGVAWGHALVHAWLG